MARNTRVLAALAALSLVVAACGGSSESSDTTAAAGGSLELVKDGSLTVCSEVPYEPFEYKAEDGTYTGFDMDRHASKIAGAQRALNLEVTVRAIVRWHLASTCSRQVRRCCFFR